MESHEQSGNESDEDASEDSGDNSDATAVVKADRTAPWLSNRLLAPSTLLSVVLFALTVLPMTSCSSSDDGQLVPMKLAVSMATGPQVSTPVTAGEYVLNFVSMIPILFAFTMPYWTALPAIAAAAVIWFSSRWATRLWRLLILLLSLSVTLYLLESDVLSGKLFGSVGLLAAGIWLWSSPTAARTTAWVVGLFRRGRKPDWTQRPRQSVVGGYWAMAVLCFSAFFFLWMMHETLLYGGKLSAMANVSLGFTSIVSARQARIDGHQWPRFSTRDLLILTVVFAVSLWWFWAR
ncbi:MAG: hypothetical protein HKN47_20845 [Pirellulaceae bacterium]|nr:hypothetical protein [Pirellulaceae bacterium]